MKREYLESKGLAYTLLMRDSTDDGSVYWRGVLILYIIPFITLMSICFIKYKQRKQEPALAIEAADQPKEE